MFVSNRSVIFHHMHVDFLLKTSISLHISLVSRQKAQIVTASADTKTFCSLYKLQTASKGSGNLWSLPLSVRNTAHVRCQMHLCQLKLPQFQLGPTALVLSVYGIVRCLSPEWLPPSSSLCKQTVVHEVHWLRRLRCSRVYRFLLLKFYSLSHLGDKVEWGKPLVGERQSYCPGQNNQDPIHQEDGSCRWAVKWIPQAAEAR